MGEGAHALTLLRRVKDHGDGLRVKDWRGGVAERSAAMER